ncbi:hypothetical protein ACFPYI_02060 [Halomarina salina]|uniref:DUF7344 domain-containing protein n=1 Tax=Halomarina salina TaxID=1872699 RepID=A0ABD5RIH1_9EURY|nr:hypothetical protein [Halomarina salina]
MSTHSTTSPFADEPNLQTEETLGRLFADPRRRTLLRVLASCEGRVELDRLTERVVDAEGSADHDDPSDQFDRTLVSLYHCHLPVLADADLVTIDDDDGVFVTPDPAALDQLL